MRFRSALISLLAMIACSPVCAAGKHVKWSAKLEPADARAGESAQIVLTAELDKDWHVYSQTTPPGGAKRTEIELELGEALTPEGSAVQPAPSRKKDPNFPVDVEAYE